MSEKEDIRVPDSSSKKGKDLTIEGYPIQGLSIGGQETCIIFPSLNLAFDIGRCPARAVCQDFLLISHSHMDHIGGLPMYVATRGLYRMKPPTIIVPASVKEDVERLFEVHRKLDHSELKHNLVGLDVGEEFYLRNDIKVKAFKTYHVIPSQGYILYSVKKKLKHEYLGLPGNEIKKLKFSGVEITYTLEEPEIAFTGDTMADFIVDHSNIDALRARILVMECTFVNDSITVTHARDYGHTHLSESLDNQSCWEVAKPSNPSNSLLSALHSRGNSTSHSCIASTISGSNLCTYRRFLRQGFERAFLMAKEGSNECYAN